MSIFARHTLDTRYFSTHPPDRGLILDFTEEAQRLPENTGADYIAVLDWRIRSPFHGARDVKTRRASDAETRIIAFCDDAPQEELPDITASAMCIKNSKTMHIALPDVFDFALSRIHVCAVDVLKLYGAETFEKAEMWFIVQRTDVEPGQCHRPHISQWHNHVAGGENTDMAYLFHNVLGTENRLTIHEGGAIQTLDLVVPDHAVSRLGGEIVHRPQQNGSGTTLRREWGGLTIKLEPEQVRRNANCRAANPAMVDRNHPLFAQFREKARDVLEQDRRIHALPASQTLIEYMGVDVNPV